MRIGRALVVVGATVVLLLAGCAGEPAPPVTAPAVTRTLPASPSASASTAPTATRTAAPRPTATRADPDPNRPPGQCPDGVLGVSITGGEGAAGSAVYRLLFTNTGGSTCTLRGAPGVSVVGAGDGTQLGPPADRVQEGAATLRLAPGATVVAPLQVVDIRPDGGPLDGCQVVDGDGFRVYPPHSRRAFFVESSSAVACANGPSFMRVGVVERQ